MSDSKDVERKLIDDIDGGVERRLIGGMFLSKDEVERAVTSLYDKYGKSMTLWDQSRKIAEINLYWVSRGKSKVDIN